MAIDLIVAAVTLLVGGFVLIWCWCPWLRPWMEAPKYRILTWERSYAQVVRRDAPAEQLQDERRPPR